MDGEEYKKWYLTKQETQRLKEKKQQKQYKSIVLTLMMLIVGLIDLFFIVIYLIALIIEIHTLISWGVFRNILYLSFVALLTYIFLKLNDKRKK